MRIKYKQLFVFIICPLVCLFIHYLAFRLIWIESKSCCLLPLGIVVECQISRSQTQNKKLAMQKLRSKLFQIECEKRDSKVDSARRFQV